MITAAGISAKSLAVAAWPTPSAMLVIVLGVVATALAVPPLVPGRVMPFSVPLGCVGSRSAYVPAGRLAKR